LSAEALFAGFVLIPDARTRLPAYLLLAGAAGLLALLAAGILSAAPRGLVLLAAGLFRATVLFRSPDLSDDIYRYLWDARVAAAGFSPWAHPPDDSAVAWVAPGLRFRLPYRDVKSVYPPVAEAAFHLGSFGGTRPRLLKALFAAADVGIVWLLAQQGSGFGAALYAFHPLPVLESAGAGHVDSLGVALLLASLVFLAGRRRALAGAGYALSVLTKYVPLAAVLPVLRRGGWRFALSGAGLSAALWVGSALRGASPAGDLFEYASRWEFNSVLYPAAIDVVRSAEAPARAKAAFLGWKEKHGHPAWTQAVFPYFYDGFFARALLGGLLAVLLAAIGWRVRETRAATFASLGAILLFSPTLHPWYLLWTLPFAAERCEPAFLYLSLAAPLSYGLLYATPGLSRPLILTLEYVPFAFLLAWTLSRGLGRALAARARMAA
jgi:alpha-1,6-mannosyltransferase